MRFAWLAVMLLLLTLPAGCGTSVWSDTKRTATEQLLISDAMDRAVSKLDFHTLAGKQVYLDDKAVQGAVDHEYLTSSMRQHMLACGCLLKEKQQEADYVVELRAGAVGTDRHDVLYGVPSVNVPTILPLSGVPTAIPEIPLCKKTDQRAVVKIAVFAYNRKTGRPVWQSGIVPVESLAKDFWFFGAGPFQRGSIYGGMSFAGDKFDIPLVDLDDKWADDTEPVSVADEACFVEPNKGLAADKSAETTGGSSSKVVKAVAAEPVPESPTKSAPPALSDPPKSPRKPSPKPSQAVHDEDRQASSSSPDVSPAPPKLSPPSAVSAEPLPDRSLWPDFPGVDGEILDAGPPPPVLLRIRQPSQALVDP